MTQCVISSFCSTYRHRRRQLSLNQWSMAQIRWQSMAKQQCDSWWTQWKVRRGSTHAGTWCRNEYLQHWASWYHDSECTKLHPNTRKECECVLLKDVFHVMAVCNVIGALNTYFWTWICTLELKCYVDNNNTTTIIQQNKWKSFERLN